MILRVFPCAEAKNPASLGELPGEKEHPVNVATHTLSRARRGFGRALVALIAAAVRDSAVSRPNVTIWVLTCGNARYRVRLVPDMAAQVTQLK